jgi:hypothetical protein
MYRWRRCRQLGHAHTHVALQALPPACRAGLDAPPLLDRCGAREVRRVRAALRIRRDGSSTREGSCQRGTSRALHAAAVDRRAALIQGCPWRGSGCGHMRTGGEEGIALQGVVQEIMRLRTPTAAGGREPERQARTFLSPGQATRDAARPRTGGEKHPHGSAPSSPCSTATIAARVLAERAAHLIVMVDHCERLRLGQPRGTTLR